MYPDTFQARISVTAAMKSKGLLLAEPAIMKFQFIKPPKKAAIPAKAPTIKPIPTNTSPTATSLANQV